MSIQLRFAINLVVLSFANCQSTLKAPSPGELGVARVLLGFDGILVDPLVQCLNDQRIERSSGRAFEVAVTFFFCVRVEEEVIGRLERDESPAAWL